ncbi:MAG: S8 family peptidase [bacterium]|nr:S8 family peptidase [bacterium]
MRIALGIVVLCGVFNCAWATDGGVGIYFDQEAASNCMQEVSAYPISIAAYLIIVNPAVSGGISAWEGRIETDAAILVTGISFLRDAVNVGIAPEVMVGYAVPILPDSLMVLARIDAVALGPGAFYFGPLDHPSQPWIERPVYVDSDYPHVFTEMRYSVGGDDLPVAIIGEGNCPSPNPDGLAEEVVAEEEVSSAIATGTIVTMMLAPDDVALPDELDSARISSSSIASQSLLSVLAGRGAFAIARTYPDFDRDRLVRVNRFGETVRLIDMSSIFHVLVNSPEDAEGLVAELQDLDSVAWAYVPGGFERHGVAVSDPLYVGGQQWGLRNTGWRGGYVGFDIDVNRAWDFTVGANDVKIAAVDGPVDETHPDLAGRVTNISTGEMMDHPTEVVSVAAASRNGQGMVGVDWECTIVNLTDELTESNSDLIENINTGIDLDVDVLIHSYHTLIGFIDPQPGEAPDHKIACANAYNMGILNVCAAGNDNTSTVYYPAGFNDICFAVGGANRFGSRWERSDTDGGSNYGNHVDVMAPADSVVMVNGAGWTTIGIGTSYAAPFVAGVASLLLAEYPGDWIFPELWPNDLMSIMRLTARDMGGPPYMGQGLVQAGAAIMALKAPNLLTHGSIAANEFQQYSTLGPFTTRLYGFDGIYDGALCRVTYRWMKAEAIPVGGIYDTSHDVEIWQRGYTAGYSYESPVYNYGWAALSYYPSSDTISASTFILDVVDLNSGLHHTFPPNGELNVKYSMLGRRQDLSAVVADPPKSALICSPNPFNARVRVKYQGRPGELARIAIFDVAGRCVRDLYSGVCQDSAVELNWDGNDSEGQQLSSGGYFVRVESGGESIVKRVVLIK